MQHRWWVLALVLASTSGARANPASHTPAPVQAKPAPAPSEQPAPDTDTSEAAYARHLIAALARLGHHDAHFDAAHHQITGPGVGVISTTNLYAEWLALPANLRPLAVTRVAQTFVAGEHDKDPELADARSRLLPVVRSRLYFNTAALTWKHPKKPLPAIPFSPLGDAAGAGVGIDSPDSISVVSADQVKRWKTSFDHLQQIAIANLRAKSPSFRQVEPGVWTSQTGDSYDASRILLVSEIRALHLAGGAVALIPNRDLLLLAGKQDATGLLAIAERAEAASDQPRPIHMIALCLGARGWAECLPDVTPKVRARYRELALESAASAYNEQKQYLQQKLGDDVFVASVFVLQNKHTGQVSSYATWSKTVPTLLPHADFVAFVDLDTGDKPKMLGLVPWKRVMAVCGAHLRSDGRWPERWSTGDWFPSKRDLARMKPAMDAFGPAPAR